MTENKMHALPQEQGDHQHAGDATDLIVIQITRTRVFKKQVPKPGAVFYVAKFNKKRSGYEQGFQIWLEEEKKQGEPAIQKLVRQLVLNEHFNAEAPSAQVSA